MPKKKISETEYAAFLEEIKSKIRSFQDLFGEEALNLEHIAEQYEKMAFSNDTPEPDAPISRKKNL